MGLTSFVKREVGYVREDAARLRARLRLPELSPQKRSLTLLVSGLTCVVFGLAQWAVPLAWVVGGFGLIIAGFVLVDLDPPARRRRRTAAVRRKA